jgi:hypothetical protein
MQQQLTLIGYTPTYMDAETFTKYVFSQEKIFVRVAKEAKLKQERAGLAARQDDAKDSRLSRGRRNHPKRDSFAVSTSPSLPTTPTSGARCPTPRWSSDNASLRSGSVASRPHTMDVA